MKIVLPLFLLLSLNALGAKDKISFNKHIRPILSDKCYFCHGPDAADIKGDLQLHTLELASSDRDGKGAAIVPGNVEKSLLWDRITTNDPEEIMPPPERHAAVTPKEIETIRQWIEQGAEYEDLWSFQPLPKKVEVPAKSFEGDRNAIDRFVHQVFKEEELKPAPEAKPDVLLRRVYLTLTGLVPTPGQIAEFKADKSGKAYENLVDRLLQSQEFAERLAVDWMDLARYADSYGYQIDRERSVWLWRDWVLRSLKHNMSYDQFITQQLAGDLMPDSDDQMKLATAFNRLHMQKNEGGSTPEEFRTEYVADRAQTAATAFLGLTMECSRCHDHKYDPISMKDYFSTYAFFNNIDEAGLYSYFTKAIPSPSMPVMSDAEKKTLAGKEQALARAEKELADLRKSERAIFDQWVQTWGATVAVKGQIGEFNFDAAAKGKIPNLLAPKVPGTYDSRYSKVGAGREGKGMILDGDSELNFGALGPYERHRDLSFSVWINTPTAHQRAVILHRTRAWNDAASRGYELLMLDGKLNVAMVHFSPGNEIRIQAKEKLPINSWKQITVTYDGSSKAAGIKLYVDGELVETEILKDHLTKEIFYSAKKDMGLSIGARFRDSGLKGGKIDEFRMFERKLTALEVRENFAPGAKAKNGVESYDYYLEHESEAYQAAYQEVLAKRKDVNEYMNGRHHMMVMKEMPKRRKTYLLKRGLYSTPDLSEVIEPSPPKKVFPFGPEYSRDRLGLAKWLTHPEHPLTSRVAVNRYWQMIFGNGLVTTTNDFGSQGAYPSHPELLDYLSRSFIASGWDVRALVKQIVMSQTFRQSSNMSAELNEKDPDNKWLARGPSYYLSAEMLRDNALHTAGLLNNQLGGPSVKPYSPKKNQYRRSLYTHWKRNAPSPEMLIFGAPRRQVCSVKREKTSTPLQPLVLMNSPQIVESCRNTAGLVMAQPTDDAGKIQFAFLKLTGREVSDKERAIFIKLLAQQRAYFKQSADIANNLTKIGEVKTGQKDKQELAAWTVIVNTMMNLDGFYMLR